MKVMFHKLEEDVRSEILVHMPDFDVAGNIAFVLSEHLPPMWVRGYVVSVLVYHHNTHHFTGVSFTDSFRGMTKTYIDRRSAFLRGEL